MYAWKGKGGGGDWLKLVFFAFLKFVCTYSPNVAINDYPIFFFPFLEIFFSRDEYFKTFQERGDVNVFLVKWKYFKFLSTTPLSLSVCIYFNSLRSWFEQCLNFRACIVSRINDVPLTFYFIYRARRIAFFRS